MSDEVLVETGTAETHPRRIELLTRVAQQALKRGEKFWLPLTAPREKAEAFYCPEEFLANPRYLQ